MNRTAVALAAAALTLVPAVAPAHPLGNFTTNRWAALRLDARALVLAYVVDLAEIPSVREIAAIDTDGDGTLAPAERDRWLATTVAELGRNLHVTVDDVPVALAAGPSSLETATGAGGLATLRIEAEWRATLPSGRGALAYRDENFPGRPGWQEVIATGADGTTLAEATVPATDASSALHAYPQDQLAAPPQVREARLRFAPGTGASAPTAGPLATTTDPRRRDRFTELIATRQPLDAWLVLSSLAIAATLGALHALSPGHGKTVVGAYLVGARGTAWHAVVLGLVVTATHTLGVYALGLASLLASQWIVPERLLPWLGVGSGLLVLGIGATMVVSRLAAVAEHAHPHDHAHPHHHHGHDHPAHDHDHGHSHVPPSLEDGLRWRSLVALGVSGGLLPCPSALVVMLGAIALGRVAFGLLLIVAFSAGLAAVLTGIGILMVRARSLLDHLPLDGRFARWMPVASAVVISFAGLALVAEALAQMGA